MTQDCSSNKWVRRIFTQRGYSTAKLVFFAFLSCGLSVLLAYSVYESEHSFPNVEELSFREARLLRAEKDKYGIDIGLVDGERTFRYYSKARCLGCVWRVLRSDSIVEIGHSVDGDGTAGGTVYQISVDGRVVRSYDDIRAGYAGDNRIGFWLVPTFFVIGFYLMACAYFTNKCASD